MPKKLSVYMEKKVTRCSCPTLINTIPPLPVVFIHIWTHSLVAFLSNVSKIYIFKTLSRVRGHLSPLRPLWITAWKVKLYRGRSNGHCSQWNPSDIGEGPPDLQAKKKSRKGKLFVSHSQKERNEKLFVSCFLPKKKKARNQVVT